MSLVETQKLSIKLLQDELGEEAEFDVEETAPLGKLVTKSTKTVPILFFFYCTAVVLLTFIDFC
jgi:hypothetical protein